MNIGASDKDGIEERGFRGIGRLGGLAYADKVKFVTSACGDTVKTTMLCDCMRMQQLLQNPTRKLQMLWRPLKLSVLYGGTGRISGTLLRSRVAWNSKWIGFIG